MASTATVTINSASGTYLEYKVAVACDSTPSAVPTATLDVEGWGAGDLTAVGIKCPSSAFPAQALTITIKDANGIPIFVGTVTGTASLVQRLALSDGFNDGKAPFIGPLTLTQTGNTTASATWNLYITVF
jgi:hypothetical protein